MAVAMHQIRPVAHLPVVLGVVRKRNVAALIDTFCPPHPAHVLSCGRGVEARLLASLDGHHALYKQPPQNTRPNTLPVKCIDGAFVMRHAYLARAVGELMQLRETSSGPHRVLPHAPEAFEGIAVMATMGR
jgi:hypothetical protein